jgi:hypothetical protein
MKILKTLWIKFNCFIGNHDWTCKAEQGIKPTEEELRDPIAGFKLYAGMYCKHCGRISRLSL